jgi:hypothetical protein
MITAKTNEQHPPFTGLADDLEFPWKAPRLTMRTRQRLVRTLIAEIIDDVDERAGEIVLVIHSKGGQHSELRLRKPQRGEHRCRTSEDAMPSCAAWLAGGPTRRSQHR